MVPAAGSALPERSGGGAGSLRGISAEHGRAATWPGAFRVPAVGNKYSIDFRSSEIPVFCQGIGQVLLRIFMGVQKEGCSENVCAARIFLRAGEKRGARREVRNLDLPSIDGFPAGRRSLAGRGFPGKRRQCCSSAGAARGGLPGKTAAFTIEKRAWMG